MQDIGITISDIFCYSINSGENTLFWLVDWDGNGPLYRRFPALFCLDKRKGCFINVLDMVSKVST